MRYLALIVTSLLFLSCSREGAREPKGKVLARVGDEVLTDQDLKALLSNGLVMSEENTRSFVNEWVRNTLFYLAAKEDGLERDEEVIKRMKWTTKVALAQEYWAKKLANITVSEDAVDSLMSAKGHLFDTSVNMVLVFFEDPVRGNPIRRSLLSSRRYRRNLKELAKDPTLNLEETGWISLGSLFYEYRALPQEMETLVVNMKRGDVSPVLSLDDGVFLVFKVLGKRGEKIDSVETKNLLREVMIEGKRKFLEDSLEVQLRERFPVWIGGLTQ